MVEMSSGCFSSGVEAAAFACDAFFMRRVERSVGGSCASSLVNHGFDGGGLFGLGCGGGSLEGGGGKTMDTGGASLSAFGGVVARGGFLRSDGGSLGTGFGALRVTGLAAETEEMGASSDERSGGGGLALGFFALAVSNISTLSVPPGDCDCLRAGEPRGGEVGEPTKRAWWRAAIASTAAWPEPK